MKKWFSLLLSLVLICTSVLGDIPIALAEEQPPVAVNDYIEPDVSLSMSAGDTGLEIDVGEWEDLPGEGDLPVDQTDDGDTDSGADAEAGKPISELPNFENGYVGVLSGDTCVYDEAGEEAVALAMIGKGDIVLSIDRVGSPDRLQVVFNTEQGIVKGYVDADALVKLSATQIDAFMNEATANDVVLYNDNLDFPLSTLNCTFVEVVNDVPEVEPTEPIIDEGEGEPTASVTDDIEVEPTAPVVEDIEVEPTASATGEAEVEPTAPVVEDIEVEPTASATDEAEVEPTALATDEGEPAEVDNVEGVAAGDVLVADPAQENMFALNATVEVPTLTTLSPSSVNMAQNESFALKALDANGATIAAEDVVYVILDNSDVATVDATGLVTALQMGTCTVSVTYNENTLTCAVDVCNAPSKIIVPEETTLGVGQVLQINAAFEPDNAASLITYISDDSNIASVNEEGLVTAVAEGSVVINATTASGLSAQIKVNILQGPTEVVLSATELLMGVGESKQLTFTASPEQSLYGYEFTSSNIEVATISPQTGEIKALSVGATVITLKTTNGVYAECQLEVQQVPTKLKFESSAVTLGVGQITHSPQVIFLAGSEQIPSVGELTYKSSSSKVLVDAKDGRIGGKSIGTAVITATAYNGAVGSYKVTVKKAPTSIGMTPTSGYLSAGGQTGRFKVTLSSGSAAGLTYSSSEETVATIDETGLITALNPGSTVITVKTHNGKKDTSVLKVYNAPEYIELSQAEAKLGVGQKLSLTAKAKDINGATVPANYTFRSSDENVVKVDSSTGKLEALANGNATIYVTTHNDKHTHMDSNSEVETICDIKVVAAPAEVKFNISSTYIGYKEKSTVLQVTLVPPEGEEECAASITYISRNPKIVAINATSGAVYGAKVGSTYVYAQAHTGKYARCKITVRKAPAKCYVSPTSLKLSANGMQYQLKASVNSGAASSAYTYTSSNKDAVTVDAKGLLTSVGVGKSTITVKAYNGKYARCTVTVYGEPTQVKLSAKEVTIGEGQKLSLKASALASDGSATTSKYTFSTDSDAISLNTSTGAIVGLTKGTAVVKVKTHNGVDTYEDGGIITETECIVKVVAAPAEVKFNISSTYIGYKEKSTVLQVTLVPPEGEEECAALITYISRNPKIVAINATSGAIYGAKIGSTYVYAQAHTGKYARCKITVRKAPTKCYVSPTSLKLSANGMQYQLKASVNSGTFSSAYTYTSSNKDAVTVDAKGLLTSVGAGTSKITVKSYNGKYATCNVTVYGEPAQVILPETITIGEGDASTITASVLDANDAQTITKYAYSTVDGTGSITIDPNTGAIKAIKTGTAFIKVKTHNDVTTHQAGGKVVETICNVNIVDAPTSLEMNTAAITLGVGEYYTLKPAMYAPDGSEMSGSLKYTRSNSVIAINSSGLMKASKTGTCTVTAVTYNGLKVTCRITVKKAPTKVSISYVKATLGVGQTAQYKVTLPSGSGGSYTFSSSNKAVATIDEKGKVTALSAGVSTITVKTYNGKTAKSTLTVYKAPEFMLLNTDCVYDEEQLCNVYYKVMKPGQSFQLKYQNEYNSRGNVVAYESYNPDVASVSSSGLIKAKKSGVTLVGLQSSSGVVEFCTVIVQDTTGKLQFEASTMRIGIDQYLPIPNLKGDIDELEAVFISYGVDNPDVVELGYDEDYNLLIKGLKAGSTTLYAQSVTGAWASMTIYVGYAPYNMNFGYYGPLITGETADMQVSYSGVGTYELSTSDENIAVITNDGQVKAIAVGEVTITATAHNGYTYSKKMQVRNKPKSVSLDIEQAVLGVGDQLVIKPIINDEEYTTFSYSTSNSQVAYVNNGGIIAKAPGTARITVKTSVPGVFATCDITVVAAPDGMELLNGYMVLPVNGKSEPIQVRFTRADGMDCKAKLLFGTSNLAVASVDANGVITGVSPGSASIKVHTDGGLSQSFNVVVKPEAEALAISPQVLRLTENGAAGAFALTVPEGDEIASVTSSNDTIYESLDWSTGDSITFVSKAVGEATLDIATKNGHGITCKIIISATPTEILLDSSDVVLGIGESHAIQVTLEPKDTWTKLFYASDDAEKATVDGNGKILATGVGETFIKVYNADETLQTQVKVTIGEAPESIRLESNALKMCAGMTHQLTQPILLGANGSAIGKYIYAIENEKIATVDANGLITSHAEGDTTLSVRAYNGVSAKMQITVTSALVAIEFAEANIQMALNETYAPTVLSDSGVMLSASFSSSNDAIVSVNVSGQLVANTVGETTITATYGGLTAKATVNVLAETKNVGLSATEITLGVRDKFTLDVTLDENAASATIEFKSSDEGIASVGADGVITANSVGDAIITATAFGGASASCTVHALALPTKVSLAPAEIYACIEEGGTQLSWEFGASDQGGRVKFETDDESIATVDANGYVSFHALGRTQVGVVTYNGQTAVIPVYIVPAPTSVSFKSEELVILKGDTVSNPAIFDQYYENYSIKSDAESVVTVDKDGNFTGVNVGEATVTVETKVGLTATSKVRVIDALEGIQIVPETLSLALGEEANLEISFLPVNTMATLKYISSNDSIATVDENGHVKAISSGSCKIQAIAPDNSAATCEVTVNGARHRLFMAYEYANPSFKYYLPFTPNSVGGISNTFGNSEIGGESYDMTIMKDPSKNALLNGISRTFADSTDSDVSVVYMLSHGLTDINGTGEFGFTIPGYTNQASSPYYYVTGTELMSCIRQIKGQVVVILIGCYSGNFIDQHRGTLQAEGGRISVLTATNKTNASYYNVASTAKSVEYFTYYLLMGMGYDAQARSFKYDLRADTNKDKCVTVEEMFNYGRKGVLNNVPKFSKNSWFWGNGKQTPQVYLGNNADLVIYQPK